MKRNNNVLYSSDLWIYDLRMAVRRLSDSMGALEVSRETLDYVWVTVARVLWEMEDFDAFISSFCAQDRAASEDNLGQDPGVGERADGSELR